MSTVRGSYGIVDYEAENVRVGEPPSSCWMAMEHPSLPMGMWIVALVGLSDQVIRFVRKAGIARDVPGNAPLALCPIGLWPEDGARATVLAMNTDGSGPRQWARVFKKRVVKDPTRQIWAPDADVAAALVDAYVQQVRMVLGGS